MKHLITAFFVLLMTAVAVRIVFWQTADLAHSVGLQMIVGACMVGAPLIAIPTQATAAGTAAIDLWRRFKGTAGGAS